MSPARCSERSAGSRSSARPIWLMRQAGRYLPEYRSLRARAGSFLDLCYTPDLAHEITLQPIRRFGMDAAILFSDILVVADALGCPVAFVEGFGPKLEPVRSSAAVARLRPRQAARRIWRRSTTPWPGCRQDLPSETALIGFAGAPWTVAAYMVEGEGSKEFSAARAFARQRSRDLRPPDRRADRSDDRASCGPRSRPVPTSCSCSTAGPGSCRSAEFVRWCQEPAARIVQTLKAGVPEGAADRVPARRGVALSELRRSGPGRWPEPRHRGAGCALPGATLPELCLQGNLDPVALLTGGPGLRREAERDRRGRWGRGPFIFNLGHGVLPDTDPEEVAALVAHVRSLSAAGSRSTGPLTGRAERSRPLAGACG